MYIVAFMKYGSSCKRKKKHSAMRCAVLRFAYCNCDKNNYNMAKVATLIATIVRFKL